MIVRRSRLAPRRKAIGNALALAAVVAVAVVAPAPRALAADAAADTSAVAAIRREAEAVRPLFKSKLVADYLDATARLPLVQPRALVRDSARTRYWTAANAASFSDSTRARLVSVPITERFYWYTRYGTPIAYARALEIAANAGFASARGKKVLDFGYGGIGQLRLLAESGAEAVGVEVDPLLPVMYGEPGDQGKIGANGGSVRLVHGQWPASDGTMKDVGGGYDLVVSKNVLKRGYIHPERPADPKQLVHLGVDDSTFVARLGSIVKPGGVVVVYNLSPAPSKPDQPYRPWTDGRSPFTRETWESGGFEVLEFERDDSAAARAMAKALGWDQGGMDLANDLFAHSTVLKKRT
jgi:hypothetical protein